MSIFDPSIYIAMFPYLFMASFPVFGLVIVTKWVYKDFKEKRKEGKLRQRQGYS